KDWGDEGYIWIDYNFFKSGSVDDRQCCILVYELEDTVKALFGANGGEHAVREGGKNGGVETYGRMAKVFNETAAVQTEKQNFELPAGKTVENLQEGQQITVKDDLQKLRLHSDLAVAPESGKVLVGQSVGNLKGGDTFTVSDVKKITVDDGKRTE